MTRRQFSFPVSSHSTNISQCVHSCIIQIDKRRMTDLFARELPHFKTLCNCSSVQASRSTDLTRLIWVPIPLWMPEQRMQTKIPRFHEAHRGSAKKNTVSIIASGSSVVMNLQ
jgi:hypothetical protein